jgi:hypothetical protein
LKILSERKNLQIEGFDVSTSSYETNASNAFTTFEFFSEGPKGTIKKIVRYTQIESTNSYNLVFGDEDPETGIVDDRIISNSSDHKKVLATVASTLLIFLENYPEAAVFAVGSTSTRTRLYQMGIANNLELINLGFTVWGLVEGKWEFFERGSNYSAFLVRRNKVTL